MSDRRIQISPATELSFIAYVWAGAVAGDPKAERVMAGIPPEALHDQVASAFYRVLCDRYAAGVSIEPANAELARQLRAIDREATDQVLAQAEHASSVDLTRFAWDFHTRWSAEQQTALLKDFSDVAGQALEASEPERALKAAEDVALKVLTMQAERAAVQAPQSRDEIVDAEIASLEAGGVRGITWPFPKMQRMLGSILPGRVIGITAFPNGGKSTLLANLFRLFIRRNVPCLVAPTEMRTDWLRRAWAAEARVPQEIAENQMWSRKDEEMGRYLQDLWECDANEVIGLLDTYRQRYGEVVELSRHLPWEVINKSDITVDQVIARWRILRRRYPGVHVIGMLDHLHNLSYPGGETDKHVGGAIRRIREFCLDDREGGFSAIVLLQPKKPERHTNAEYKPIYAREIRGQVAQVLDVHMSLYRRWVKTSTAGLTPWGTPLAARTATGGLYFAEKPGEEDAKLDDEDVYLKPDKRRIGGEGNTFMLDFNAPTGEITERARLAAVA
jgi:replicative DNA helicase